MAEEITTTTTEELEGECLWTERPVDELVERYGKIYAGLAVEYGVPTDHAAQITMAIAGSESMPRFEGFLPEIETTIEFDGED